MVAPVLIVLVLLGLVRTPWAEVEPPAKVSRIGMLNLFSPDQPAQRASLEWFRGALRELGYVEGRNVVIESRSAEGRMERFPALAAELVRRKVDVIVAFNTPSALAARRATATIPIVVAAMQDPVTDGLVASLARPGGNVTGSTFLGPELVAKRLALLREAVPGIGRVAALWHEGGLARRTERGMVKEIESAAGMMGVQLQLVGVKAPGDLDGAFAGMARWHADAFIQLPSPMFYGERRRIVGLAASHRLPAMYNAREYVELGGLMSYGASISELVRASASYVDRILKGAKPADLPVQQPTKYELVINLATARALGLVIAESVLLQADDVLR